MAVSSAHILYVGSTAYDLRSIEMWYGDADDATKVVVRFTSLPDSPIKLPITMATFETAKQASLTAGG